MNYLLGVIIVLTLLGTLVRIGWIASDNFPARNRQTEIWGIVLNLILYVWAVHIYLSMP